LNDDGQIKFMIDHWQAYFVIGVLLITAGLILFFRHASNLIRNYKDKKANKPQIITEELTIGLLGIYLIMVVIGIAFLTKIKHG